MTVPLFFLTYNCAKASQSPKDWLGPALPDSAPLMMVFGFQELTSIIDGCFNNTNKYMEDLIKSLETVISEKYYQRFYRVGKSVSGAIGLVVLAQEEQVKVSKIASAACACGFFRSSLKGSAALRITTTSPIETEFTFATAHLAANEGQQADRNADFLTISRNLDFQDGYGLYKPNNHIFFIGDLNYRCKKNIGLTQLSPSGDVDIDNDTDNDNVGATSRLLTEIDPSQLKEVDELTIERANGNVLFGFAEAPVTFPPTYKFRVGSNKYTTKRIPSWCDRILYLKYGQAADQSAGGHDADTDSVKVHSYSCIPAAMGSDHKPVYLSIDIPEEPPSVGHIITRDFYLNNELHDTYLGLSPWSPYSTRFSGVADKAIGWVMFLSTTGDGRKYSIYAGLTLALLYLVSLFL